MDKQPMERTRPWNLQYSLQPKSADFARRAIDEPWVQNLGDWAYILTESDSMSDLDNRYVSAGVPNHAYFTSCLQRVFYFLDRQEHPVPTFIAVPKDLAAGPRYLERVGTFIGDIKQNSPYAHIFTGFNIAGYNHNLKALTSETTKAFLDDKNRKMLAQSAPFLHMHVVAIDPKELDNLPSLDLTKNEGIEMVKQRYSREMQLTDAELTKANTVRLARMAVYDHAATSEWRSIFAAGIPAQANHVNWRLPVGGQTPPYGLELVFDTDLTALLTQRAEEVWRNLWEIEKKVADRYGFGPSRDPEARLPSYNFAVNFVENGDKTSIIFSPHQSSRAGSLETQGIFVHRPARGRT